MAAKPPGAVAIASDPYTAGWRNCQNAMTVNAKNTSVAAPAARPSMPSVMFTAFDDPMMMKIAHTAHSQVPRSRSMSRVNEKFVDVST